jgi:fibronectin-binding autotransporter adhesin
VSFANHNDVIFPGGAARSLTFLAGTRIVNSITFQSGSGMANISLGDKGSSSVAGAVAYNLQFRSGNSGITIDSGNSTNINIGTGGLTGNPFGNVVLQSNLSVAHNGSGTLTINRPITGAFAVAKSGTGTMVLSGSNEFTAGLTISAGRLNANSASALGSNSVAMTGASTTLSFGTGTGSVTTFSNPINVTGTATGTTLIVATTAKVSLNAAITIAADTTIQGTGTDNQIGTTALGTITSSNNSNLTIAVSNSQTHVFEGKIDLGTGSVTRVAGSNANLTLSNANNSFSGGLFIGSVGGGGGGPTSGATTITTNGAQGSGDITFITGNSAPITFSNVSGTVANNIVSTGGTGGLSKSGASTMTLTGTNTYTGATTISGGTLALGASNVLPNGSAVSLGAATLRVGAGFTDTAGTLAVTAAAAIDLGDADSKMAFAKSNAVNWTGGTLNLTGSFVSGASLRFGTDNTGLSAGQLASITATGLTGFALNGDGYLTASAPGGFSSWITGTFANGSVPGDKQGPNDDADNDGISNLVEYAVDGQDPTVPNASIGTFAANTLSFTKRAGTSGLTYAIQESTDLGIADDWTEVSGPAYVNNPSTISYTLTPGTPAKNFTRLMVTAN